MANPKGIVAAITQPSTYSKAFKKFDKFMKKGRIDKVANKFMPKMAS